MSESGELKQRKTRDSDTYSYCYHKYVENCIKLCNICIISRLLRLPGLSLWTAVIIIIIIVIIIILLSLLIIITYYFLHDFTSLLAFYTLYVIRTS